MIPQPAYKISNDLRLKQGKSSARLYRAACLAPAQHPAAESEVSDTPYPCLEADDVGQVLLGGCLVD